MGQTERKKKVIFLIFLFVYRFDNNFHVYSLSFINKIFLFHVQCFCFRVSMQDYGNFVPEALKSSSDIALRSLGEKLELFPLLEEENTYLSIGFKNVLEGTHALLETDSYLRMLQVDASATKSSYIMKEGVRLWIRLAIFLFLLSIFIYSMLN